MVNIYESDQVNYLYNECYFMNCAMLMVMSFMFVIV